MGNNQTNLNDRFNLKGLVNGNGFTDPEIQIMSHGITSFEIGLIDAKQKKNAVNKASKAI